MRLFEKLYKKNNCIYNIYKQNLGETYLEFKICKYNKLTFEIIKFLQCVQETLLKQTDKKRLKMKRW